MGVCVCAYYEIVRSTKLTVGTERMKIVLIARVRLRFSVRCATRKTRNRTDVLRTHSKTPGENDVDGTTAADANYTRARDEQRVVRVT